MGQCFLMTPNGLLEKKRNGSKKAKITFSFLSFPFYQQYSSLIKRKEKITIFDIFFNYLLNI